MDSRSYEDQTHPQTKFVFCSAPCKKTKAARRRVTSPPTTWLLSSGSGLTGGRSLGERQMRVFVYHHLCHRRFARRPKMMYAHLRFSSETRTILRTLSIVIEQTKSDGWAKNVKYNVLEIKFINGHF